jgi:mannose-6-phosphate isomerase-like protein (cupin superfamily)
MSHRDRFRPPVPALAALAVTLTLAAPALRTRAAEDAHAAAEPAVRYYRAENVAKSFAEGAVLFAEPGINYMIHTSRRATPGMAEVHTLDTDLIHVLEGSATFVTGGTVVAPKPIAPDEIRGSSIDGGETRVLAKGDVIIVPAGMPHWFKDVRGPVLYYTVKVRPGVKS